MRDWSVSRVPSTETVRASIFVVAFYALLSTLITSRDIFYKIYANKYSVTLIASVMRFLHKHAIAEYRSVANIVWTARSSKKLGTQVLPI